jgi:membrane protease YdiL (CAAX protease family)
MKKLYENKPVLFAVLFIVLYCAVTIPIRGEYGDGSIQSLLGLSAVAAVIAIVSTMIPLWERLGVASKVQNVRPCLYFIPMIILATGNIWDGIELHYSGASLWYAMISMALVGFVEEMLFRGFLFRTLLKKDGPKVAIIVSAVTFGIGHIVNLLAGMATVENLMMIVFAVAWGFIFTMVYYKSGNLLLCILVHSVIDVLSTIAGESELGSWIYIGATVVLGGAYSLYLAKRVGTPELQKS